MTPDTRLIALGRIVHVPDDAPEAAYASAERSLAAITPLILGWDETPEWLSSSLSKTFELAPEVAVGTKPPNGFITKYPLFAALCAQPLPEYEAVTRVAQASLVVCVSRIDTRLNSAEFLSAIRSAGLAARRISQGKFVSRELIDVLHAPPSLQVISERIKVKGAVLNNLSDEEHRLVGGLRALLVYALEARNPHKRTSSQRNSNTRTRKRIENEQSLAPSHEVQEEHDEVSPEDLAEGAAASPESPRRRTVRVRVGPMIPGVEDTALSPGQRQWRAKQRVRGIASSAQGLMLASDRLHLVDLDAFETTIQRHVSGERKLSANAFQGALICCASLVCGRPLDKLKEFAVVAQRADIPAEVRKPYLVVSESALVLPRPSLGNAFVPKDEVAKLYRATIDQLTVPVPRGFGFTELLLRAANRLVGPKPFANDSWLENAETFIKQVNDERKSRISLARIAEFLERQTLMTSGDWAEAAIYCGTGDANARLHYYAPTYGYLRTLWASVWRGVAKGLGRKDIQIKTSLSWDDDLGFCSRGCPNLYDVEMMVYRLLETTRATLRGRRSRTRMIEVHNAIAVYTVMMVLWHCGARAVNDPVELKLYDPFTGFLGLNDKDTGSYHASRVVWLPPIVQRQIASYWKHLAVLRKAVKAAKIPPEDDLFLIDQKGNGHPITQKALKSALGKSYPFRLNDQRHYLRTMLRELGVPGQVVDAQMGHGAIGQEPYGAHSCFSPQRLRIELGPALMQLSEKARWEVLSGLT